MRAEWPSRRRDFRRNGEQVFVQDVQRAQASARAVPSVRVRELIRTHLESHISGVSVVPRPFPAPSRTHPLLSPSPSCSVVLA